MTITHENALMLHSLIQEYRIEGILGHGGFGITYKAMDTHLNRLVAIKEYLPHEYAVKRTDGTIAARSSRDQEAFQVGLKRFMEEAQTLAQFNHRNIVRVHRCFPANSTGYMVMEYEKGETLGNRLEQLGKGGRMSEGEIRGWLDDVLDGLQAVHACEIMHRDLKPDNIYLRGDGRAMLIDFGAARYAVGSYSKSLDVMLTPGYAPNEQYSSRGRQGPWTDIYGLGAVLYRCISGDDPLDAPARLQRVYAERQSDPLVPISEAARGCGYDENFLRAIDRALAIIVDDRPPGVVTFRKLMRGEWTGQRAAAANGPESSTAKPPPVSVSEPEPDHMLPPLSPRKRNPWPWIALALSMVIMGITMWELGRRDGKQNEVPPIAPAKTVVPPTPKEDPLPSVVPPIHGSLVVNSDPGGADVYVDGRKIGVTPLTRDNIEKGLKHIEILKEGYEPGREDVEITPRMTVKLQINLMSTLGELDMASDPVGAEVYVDGAYQGRTPFRLGRLAKGDKKVEIRHDGYLPWIKTVRVEALKSSEVMARLERKPVEPEPVAQQSSPVGAVQAYYADLDRRDADSAINRWTPPRSSLRSMINRIEWFRVNKTREETSTANTAEVWVDVTGKNKKENPQNWTGTINLVKSGGEWKIDRMSLRQQ